MPQLRDRGASDISGFPGPVSWTVAPYVSSDLPASSDASGRRSDQAAAELCRTRRAPSAPRRSSRSCWRALACGWAGVLLGPALLIAAGLDIDLEVVWDDCGAKATSRLRAAVGPEATRAILEAVVEKRLSRCPPPPPPVLESLSLLREDPCRPLDRLPRRLGMPSRTLRRQIAGATGLGPKSLQRVFRFQAMRLRLEGGAEVQSLAVLAADLGFADQAHMSRECRAMTGRTPRGLWRVQVDGRNLQDDRRGV